VGTLSLFLFGFLRFLKKIGLLLDLNISFASNLSHEIVTLSRNCKDFVSEDRCLAVRILDSELRKTPFTAEVAQHTGHGAKG